MESPFRSVCMWLWQTDEQLLQQRYPAQRSSALVLFAVGPLTIFRLIIMVITYGGGTDWFWPYWIMMFFVCYGAFVVNWGLRYSVAEYDAWMVVHLWDVLAPISFMFEICPPMMGFISPDHLRLTPFRSVPFTMVYFGWLAIYHHIDNQICTPVPFSPGHNIPSSSTATASSLHSAARVVHPICEVILGVRMLIAAYAGACPFGTTFKCAPHSAIGTTCVLAGLVNLSAKMLITRHCAVPIEVVLEVVMLFCEAGIFTCSRFLLRYNMTVHELMEGYEDLQVFTTLCGVSTLYALVATLARFMPAQARKNMSQDPFGCIFLAAKQPTAAIQLAHVGGVRMQSSYAHRTETFESCEVDSRGVSGGTLGAVSCATKSAERLDEPCAHPGAQWTH